MFAIESVPGSLDYFGQLGNSSGIDPFIGKYTSYIVKMIGEKDKNTFTVSGNGTTAKNFIGRSGFGTFGASSDCEKKEEGINHLKSA
jgi:hypothetical protein